MLFSYLKIHKLGISRKQSWISTSQKKMVAIYFNSGQKNIFVKKSIITNSLSLDLYVILLHKYTFKHTNVRCFIAEIKARKAETSKMPPYLMQFSWLHSS